MGVVSYFLLEARGILAQHHIIPDLLPFAVEDTEGLYLIQNELEQRLRYYVYGGHYHGQDIHYQERYLRYETL